MSEQMNNREDILEVKPEEKIQPPKSPPKKELSPAEMQKRKKMLVMPLFFLIFGGIMWLIFAPADGEEAVESGLSGFNAELPMPKDDEIVGDKRDAYEREAMRQKEQEQMRSLQDFSTMFEQNEEQVNQESGQPEFYETTSARQAKPADNLQASATAYQDINKQSGSWYEEPARKSEQELAVEERMNELERKLAEAEAQRAVEDEQAALLEKSYQMAARYMPPLTGQASENNNPAPSSKDKVNVQPVKQVRHNVVSLLAAPMSDDEFMESFSQPRNMFFFTAAGNEGGGEGQKQHPRLCEPDRNADKRTGSADQVTGANAGRQYSHTCKQYRNRLL